MTTTTVLGATRRTAERMVAVAAVLILVGGGLWAASIGWASADEWPRVYEIEETSSLTCQELGALMVDLGVMPTDPGWSGWKIDPPAEVSAAGPLGVTVANLRNGDDGSVSFDWSSEKPVAAVYVKSGVSASRLYLYDPPTAATSGTGLTTTGGKQISHITFCYKPGGPTTTTTTTEPSTTTSTTEPSTTTTSTTEPSTTTSTTEPSTTTSSSAATTTSPVTPTTPSAQVLGVTQVAAPEGVLPATGAWIGLPMLVGGILLGMGGALSLAGHRRREG